jgi:hypothetical protein
LRKHRQQFIAMKDDPWKVLEVEPNAGDEAIRDAYLRKVKGNPPDRSPAAFERIRDAYEILGDPRQRAVRMLLEADPEAPLVSLLPEQTRERKFTGPSPWLAVIKEK